MARGFAPEYMTYVELVDDNPHLNALLSDKAEFNAAANQEWFLEKVYDFTVAANPSEPLVIDQDPAAIVMTYAQMFYDQGLISDLSYTRLVEKLFQVEVRLANWHQPRTVLMLDAPAEVLFERVRARSGPERTPSVEWFENVRSYFARLSQYFPNCVRVPTKDLTADELLIRCRQFLRL